MRPRVLTLGVLLILVSVFVLKQGAQVFEPVAGLAGLSMQYTEENVVLPPTIYSVPAASYSFASEDLSGGGQFSGSVNVGDGGQVAFYVMDQGNFSLWRAERPASLVLEKPLVVSYNFTFSPTASGTYYFVFANQGSSPLDVIFSLSSVQDVVVLSPIVQYAGFELLILGVILCFFGTRGGKRKVEPKPKRALEAGWRCKFCGEVNPNENRTFCSKCGRAQG